ncbi:MAG TPA: hypothetical protein VM938_11920 [Acidimicrobiales bacterium]|nr:hypothetical protein [Acidimicrobiales bacterium]
MIRRTAVAVAVIGLAAMAAPPADAHTDVCAFTGTIWTFGPTLPAISVVGGPTADWFLLPSLGDCATGVPPIAGGQITGSVFGATTGTETASGGHVFSFTGVGGNLVLPGQVTGTMTMVPNPLTTTGDAFHVTAAITLVH